MLLNLVGFPDVILITNGDEFSTSALQGAEEVAVDAMLGLVAEQLDDRMGCRIIMQHGHSPVGRAVILNDNLGKGISLSQQRVNLFGQIFFTVVSAHHNGDTLDIYHIIHASNHSRITHRGEMHCKSSTSTIKSSQNGYYIIMTLSTIIILKKGDDTNVGPNPLVFRNETP